MARVLLIEDETVLRTSMARGIAKLPGVDVSDAKDLDEALVLLDKHRPDLVISDIDLPGRSGIELLGELGRRGLSTPVIYVSAYLKAYRAQIPPHANVEVVEKPVALDDLRAMVRARLGAAPEPRPAPFSAADYLQLACTGRHSVVIHVERADVHGEIVISDGQLWSAKDDKGNGPPALRRIVFRQDVEVHCTTLKGVPGPRDVEGPWEAVLLESARLFDEELHASTKPPRPPSAPPLPPSEPPPPPKPTPEEEAQAESDARFELAWEHALEAMLKKDYPAAVQAFRVAESLRPDDPRVKANLKRLDEMGHVAPGRSSEGGRD
jgi:DNA-binding response OmpR family regulator